MRGEADGEGRDNEFEVHSNNKWIRDELLKKALALFSIYGRRQTERQATSTAVTATWVWAKGEGAICEVWQSTSDAVPSRLACFSLSPSLQKQNNHK